MINGTRSYRLLPSYSDGKFVPIKKYSSHYLRSFQFRNRRYNSVSHIMDYLGELGIIRYFNDKRGSTAGRVFKSGAKTLNIGIVTSNMRRPRYNYVYSRPSCLTVVPIQRDHYGFPSLFLTNLRSISNKFEQLCIDIEIYKPGIALLTETWINHSNDNAYEIDGYKSIHRIRDRDDKTHGGGISAYIRNDITIHQHVVSPHSKIEILSVICRSTYLPRNLPWIGIILVYFPPNDGNDADVIGYILDEYDRFMAINDKAGIFIVGDLNNLDTKSLLRLPCIKQLSDLPTRGNSCLDVCLSNLGDYYSVQVLPPIEGSDHKLLYFLPEQQISPLSSNVSVTYRKRSNSGYRLMANVLSQHDWSQWALMDSIQDMADLFYDFVTYLFHVSFPLVTEVKKANTHPWMNSQIAALIKRRNYLSLKVCTQSSLLGDLNVQIKGLITVEKNLMCRNLLQKFKSSPRDFYNMVKNIANLKINQPSADIIFPGSNAEESRALICNYFSDLLNTHPGSSYKCESFSVGNASLPKMELFDIYQQLKKLPFSNACAPGDIPSHIYRELAEFLTEPLFILFNKSLSDMSVPSQWKSGYLITLPKVPMITSPRQLRPIMITSPVAKIIERHVLSIIKVGYTAYIDPMQFGGLPDRSSCHYLSIYLHRIAMQLETRGTSVTTIFTDFAKAFDSVDHDVLINSMIKLSINPAAIRWVICFLDQRMTTLRDGDFNDALSFSSSCGIPQGSVLGGFLFIIVINSLMSEYPLRLKFIDDLTISLINYSVPDDSIQKALDDLISQSNIIKIKLNIEKCFIMHHSFSRAPVSLCASLDSYNLGVISSFKLLGVVVQSDMKWGCHVTSMISRANKKLHMLYMLRRIGASRCVLVDAYMTFIRPILEYCCPVWHPALTKAQTKSIEQVQRRVVKIILGRAYSRYCDDLIFLGMKTLEARRVEIHLKFANAFFKSFPDFMPNTVFNNTGINTRQSKRLAKPKIRTIRADKSPIVSFINVFNSTL